MPRRRFPVAIILDLSALAVSMLVASLTVFGEPFPWYARPGSGTMIASMAFGALLGTFLAFRPVAEGPSRPSYGRAVTIGAVMLATTALTIVLTRAFWSRGFVLTSTAVWLVLAIAQRWARRRRPWAERMVVISAEKALIGDLLEAEHTDVVAVLDPAGEAPDEPLPPGTTIAIDLRAVLSDSMARFVSSSSIAGYSLRSLVGTYEEHTGRLPIIHLMEGWELTVPLSGNRPYVRIKRAVDTALVLLAAPLSVLLGTVIWLAIRIESRGPAIFKQRRVGLEGRTFTLYKFRTMRNDWGDGARFAAQGDDRLTRVGRALRRIRIDELPQLWNVLRGDLSLVGPRPEQEPFVEQFSRTIPFYGHRHLVRPGLTGWSQVNFGYADSEADTVEKLSYDLYYVKHLSPWLDLEVLGRSVWTVLSGFGAR